jgi:hypothetical protein
MVRATVAQAVVTWLANQHVERDGRRQRFFDGVFGIFGHGIVAGMGEALEAAQDEVRSTRPATSRPWSTRRRLRQAEPPPAHVRLHDVHRPGCHEPVTGRQRHKSPPPSAPATASPRDA